MEYKISENVTISGFNDIDVENIPQQYRQGYYILINKNKDKEFLINETIKFYLEKFIIPTTQLKVLKQIKTELKNNSKELDKKCSEFFKFLCNRKILVPIGKDPKIISASALYKEGDIIENLCVVKVLSESRFLDVYLTLDKKTNINYVIKLLNRNKTLNKDVFLDELEDLKTEYHLLEKVKGIPFICRAVSFHTAEKYACIIMEYFEGKSLSRFLKTSPGLSINDSLEIIEGILLAFLDIHKNKLIHGDIHASNVMINENKSIRIIDLGMSFMMEVDKNEVTVFGGVNSYMPPERINITSFKKYTKPPDLYSEVYQIGLLMYRVFYNTMPFKGFIWEELAKNIKEQEIICPDNSFTGFKIPEHFKNIIKKCLSKKPRDRYRNASGILKDFRTYINSKNRAVYKLKKCV